MKKLLSLSIIFLSLSSALMVDASQKHNPTTRQSFKNHQIISTTHTLNHNRLTQTTNDGPFHFIPTSRFGAGLTRSKILAVLTVAALLNTQGVIALDQQFGTSKNNQVATYKPHALAIKEQLDCTPCTPNNHSRDCYECTCGHICEESSLSSECFDCRCRFICSSEQLFIACNLCYIMDIFSSVFGKSKPSMPLLEANQCPWNKNKPKELE